MSRTIAICQPHYLPWIGYFEMIDRVDAFYFHDDVDFIKQEWKNRNRIRKEQTGVETRWLTVPVERSCQHDTPLREVRIAADRAWRRRHRNTFRHVYRRAPHGDEAFELLDRGLAAGAASLADLNVHLVAGICAYLGITTPLERTSALAAGGRRTAKLVDLCERAGADAYLANNGSAAYLDLELFSAAGLECRYQDYVHPEYVQSSGGSRLPFVSHLSVLDLVANHGPRSLAVLREGRR